MSRGDIFLKLLNMSITACWLILAVIGILQTTDTQRIDTPLVVYHYEEIAKIFVQ